MTEQLNQGDLVMTKEGYFALVIFQMGNEVGVFLCNGLATVEWRDDLTVQTIRDGPARANFMEIMPSMTASILEQDPELLTHHVDMPDAFSGKVFTVERPGCTSVEHSIHEFVNRHLITGKALAELTKMEVGQYWEINLADFDPNPISSLTYADKKGRVILRRTT